MNVDFIRIAHQPVRVTSLKEDSATGALALVVIARGTVDRRQLSELLRSGPVMVDVPDRPGRHMDVTAVDERVVGTGEQAITRFAVELTPATTPPSGNHAPVPDDPLSARLDRIESMLEAILTILKSRKPDPGSPDPGR